MKKTQALSKLVRILMAASFGVAILAVIGQYSLMQHVANKELYQLQFGLFGGLVLLGVIAFFVIVKPAYMKFRSVYQALIESEESAKQMTQELNRLYNELGKSYQDLEAVNLVPEEPSTLMKLDSDGNVIYVSDRFKQIMSVNGEGFSKNLFEWFKEENLNEDFITSLRNILSRGESWNGELDLTNQDGDLIWLDISMQPVMSGANSSLKTLVIGRDVTEMKEAKQRSREINREAIEKRVKEQQYRSVLILEGQEEERKRISQEIHDGIGQMLTGLKLNLEGIVPSDSPHMKKRLRDTKDLMKSVIKEVRRVSFNLTPSSLVDFGITPAMKKISQEVSALTNTKVEFDNRTNFINRLDKNVETNLYRIVQEAVNNGIKYAQADKIVISFEHNPSHLIVTVADNGKGFEFEKLQKTGHFGASGHGIFNMKERAAFINGSFDIQTELGVGTKIIIKLPLS
ncbi:histidine kinase [Reichenbachiella carrageenanivorans]|uniref:histidine kinase n=1 Tax=Reichenbachiella carrageenanivorans TaxID=2979869 RepID=A0ABY6D710_9BACT|nr:ATP-binding protein [Reichenbachiella carrageenanivorans]UXX80848.1 histidine kinase [Reichenbachiella carrageenanivorans]